MGTIGATVPVNNVIGYTHLMEFLPGRTHEYTSILFFLDSAVPVGSSLLLIYFTKYTKAFLFIPLAINLMSLIIFMKKYIPESTKYLLEKG